MSTISRSAGYWFIKAALCSGRAVNQSAYEPLGKITTCNDLQSKWPGPAIIAFFDRD
ncbi:hypothetical protein ALP09_200148 [Pseudomonas amygdali pv. lachrymans]|nr:hypothetical protein ALP09_200148 [Pseudomonas amygdali pv. lachrymans]